MATGYARLEGKRIFITGATGFIGSHLVRRLVSEEAKVYTLCRKGSDTWRIRDCLPRLEIVEGDVTDKEYLIAITKQIRPQKCFHLAAYGADQPRIDPCQTIHANVIGTINLIQALPGEELECMVNFGTGYEYGSTGGALSENSAVNPNNFYAASKSAAGLFCNLYYKLDGVPIVTVRLFPVYGPFDGISRLIPATIVKALQNEELLLTSGEQQRDYIFIDDVIDGCIRAATVREAVGQTINLGTGKAHSIKAIVTKCLALMGNPVKPIFGALPYRPNEVFSLCADTQKARETLGWSYKVDLEEGLAKTIEWYRNNKHLFG